MSRHLSIDNLRKTIYYLKRNGIRKTLAAAGERLEADYYADYRYQEPEKAELDRQSRFCPEAPVTFSILVPAYETKAEHLCCLLDSLLAQTYPHWEVILADGGKSDGVRQTAAGYGDSRIRYIKLERNEGISENTNRALEAAEGDYVGLLDHDDWLTPDALYEAAFTITERKKAGIRLSVLYTDEDKCNEAGTSFYEPHFKPDFNLDLFLSNNYICHFLLMERGLMETLGLRKAFDGAQDYDLCLRAVGKFLEEKGIPEEVIGHIPKVLYHWRCHKDSTAANPASKAYAYEAGKQALEDFLGRQGWKGKVSHTSHLGFYRIDYEGGIFAQRPDVAAIGGKTVRKGRVTAGIFDENGKALYQGLPVHYSGYMHRAVLTQSAAQLSLRHWKVNPALEEWVEALENKEKDLTEEGRQTRICRTLRQKGYRLYWDPLWIIKE